MRACDELAVWPASLGSLTRWTRIKAKNIKGKDEGQSIQVGASCWFVNVPITLLTGDDLFMKLVAAVIELVCLPISQKHFAGANLQKSNKTRLAMTHVSIVSQYVDMFL